jgi:hypothetical protein
MLICALISCQIVHTVWIFNLFLFFFVMVVVIIMVYSTEVLF